MPSRFEDYTAATRTRDVMNKIATDVVERLRPKYKYGVVESINRADHSAMVVLQGAPAVKIKMGTIEPANAGDKVRVNGIGTDRYIEEVVGGGVVSGTVPVVAGTTVGRPINVQDQQNPQRNAIFDGASHPLSERFGSVAQASAVFPGAASLTDEIAFWSLQTALNNNRKIYLGYGTGIVHDTIKIPTGGNKEIEGEGPNVTNIKLRNASNVAVLETNDLAGSNPNITLRRFSVDGNRANNSGVLINLGLVHISRGDNLRVDDLEVHHAFGCGFQHNGVTGAPTVQKQDFNKLYCHHNYHWGFHNSNGVRKVVYTGLVCNYNGDRTDLDSTATGNSADGFTGGAILDHSEFVSDSIEACENGMDGVWVRNVFAISLRGVRATHNGRHGLRILGMVDSTGSDWTALSNGTLYAGSDVFFDDTASLRYGINSNTVITGIVAGPSSAAAIPATPDGWVGNENWAINFGNGSGAGTLEVKNVRATAGQSGTVHMPTPVGSVIYTP